MAHNTVEYAVLASALGGSPHAHKAVDWDVLVAMAAREEILPTVHGRLSCPPEISNVFAAIHELNGDRNRQLLIQVEKLASALNAASIQPVLLKGAAYLVDRVYQHPADRWLHDIDLLVRQDEYGKTIEIIRSLGYEPYSPKPTALVRHHSPPLIRRQDAPIEVHHSIGLGITRIVLPAEEIIQAAMPHQLGSATVRIPSPEHLMVHLIIHSQLHHGAYTRIWPSLRAMFDLVCLAQRYPISWDEIRTRFARYRKTSLLNLHLKQIETVLAWPPPFDIPVSTLRWRYRRLLWRYPTIHHVDPTCVFTRVMMDKLQVSRNLLKSAAGRRFLLGTAFRWKFYKRLFADVVRG